MSLAPLDTVLAIDVGSSRLRVSLVDPADGTLIDSQAGADAPGGDELDFAALWRELVEACGALSRGRVAIRAVAVAAQLGLVLLDERLESVRPLLTWRDTRAAGEVASLAGECSPEQWARTGRRLSPELTVARMRWLRRHEPRTLDRTRWVLSIKDALVARLTGAVISDPTHASYSGMFDVRDREWIPELAAAAEMPDAWLPRVVAADAVAGVLTARVAAELGLPEGIPCAVGGPDGTVGCLGAGATRLGATVDIAGTTDVLMHVTVTPHDDAARDCVLNAHLLEGLWAVGGPTGLTGGVIEWVARLLGYDNAADARGVLEPQALGPSLADGPVFLPTLGGSRFPTWNADEQAAISHLRADHGPADLFGAAQLGVACTIGLGLDALRALGEDPQTVIVAGGASRSPGTLQLRSDCWGVEVGTVEEPEATTIGAAILGAVAAGVYRGADEAADRMVHFGGRHRPSPVRAGHLAGALERWHHAHARAAHAPAPEEGIRRDRKP